MRFNRLKIFWLGIAVCAAITGVSVHALYRDYHKRVAEWNVAACETFVKALGMEVQKRGNIIVSHIAVDSLEQQTLEDPYRSSVMLISKHGTRAYEIPRYKFDNSLIKETKKRQLLSVVLEKHPLDADMLNLSWDSLLMQNNSIDMNTYIRLSTTDLQEQTSIVYSKKRVEMSQTDSLLSYYMGFRCEIEATGFVSYGWWQVLDWRRCFIMLFLPWVCFCFLLLYYNQLALFLQRKFVKEKTVIQEKTVLVEEEVIIEKEILLIGVEVEQAGLYKFSDGVIFDTVEKTLKKGEEERKLPPQVAALLKLFLQAKGYRLTAKGIYDAIWKGHGTPNGLYVLISRLRESLEGISSLIVDNENGDYCLKMAHSIEKSVDVEQEECGHTQELTNTY